MTTLFDVVASQAARWPDKLALLSESDGTRTFGELVERSGRLADHAVHQWGLASGDRVAIWLENRPEWVEVMLATHAASLASVPANPEWSDDELEYVLAHSASRVVVTDADSATRALALADRIDTLDHVLCVDRRGPGVPAAAETLDEVAAAAPPDWTGRRRADAGLAEGSILYTSGTTTGRPKAVPMSMELMSGGGISYEEMFGLTHRDRAMVVTPLFHGNGLGGVISSLSRGGSAVLSRRFSRSRFWRLVDLYRPTFILTLQPVMNIVMSLPPSEADRSHSFRVIISLGSAPVRHQMQERFGVPVLDWYGMTEAGMGTYTRMDDPAPPGSVGKPFEGSVLRIVREDGTEAGVGETGEIVFERATIGFDGYLADEEATAAAVEGSWFRTGDLGYLDADGYLYFVDRAKDIVRRGGENISSIEIENALRDHPAIDDVAVVAVPDEVLGEQVGAVVVVAEGHTVPDLDELRRHAGKRLAAYKLPVVVRAVDELPRTGTGKIQKFDLRQLF